MTTTVYLLFSDKGKFMSALLNVTEQQKKAFSVVRVDAVFPDPVPPTPPISVSASYAIPAEKLKFPKSKVVLNDDDDDYTASF